jgi:Uma2 family endonuclease
MTSQQLKANTQKFTELDIVNLVIEDDKPVDNFQSEQQQRLLVEPLYSSRTLPSPFLAAANVGIFYRVGREPIVPDMFLSLGIERPSDFSPKQNRCYIVEKFGKVPDVAIEIVSNRKGDELTISRESQRKNKTATKKDVYAEVGIKYYVVFDPLKRIQTTKDMNNALLRVWKMSGGGYREITTPEGMREIGEWIRLDEIELGLKLWSGKFEEEHTRLWLRWCDVKGEVIPTGAEAKEQSDQRAEQERQRAEQSDQLARRLAAQLRSLGIDPEQIT